MQLYEWQKKIRSPHGTPVHIDRGATWVYDLDNYCRGRIGITDKIGGLIFNQEMTQALGIFLPRDGIIDTRSGKQESVTHRDMIRYIIENTSQVKKAIYLLDNLEELKKKQFPDDDSEWDVPLGAIEHGIRHALVENNSNN